MKKIFNFFKNYNFEWKIIDRIWIILWIIWFWITIFQILPTLNQTKTDVQIIQEKLSSNEAQDILYSYFYNIEQRKFENAFNLFTEQKKKWDNIGKFSNWLKDFVAFEWLKITELKEKDSAIKKVFLTEFWFKKRWIKSINSKWWFYLVYNWKTWKIDYSNVLYENWYKNWACDFYKFKDYCK